jgi:hypothetical protein
MRSTREIGTWLCGSGWRQGFAFEDYLGGQMGLLARMAGAMLIVASSSALAKAVVVVAERGPLPYMKQGAQVTVLFDGKPEQGVWVHVSGMSRNGESYQFATDGDGRVRLPNLPAGSYSISASSDANVVQGGELEVCVEECAENEFETTEFAFASLHGPVVAIDRNTLGMSEIFFDLAPDRMPEFRESLAQAELEPAALTLSELHGVVTDQSGAVIPGASVMVMTKASGQGQKGHDQLVASLSTSPIGEFSASLGPGDYYVVISARGFQSKAIHVVITPDGSPEKAQVQLKVGSASTQIITVSKLWLSEYRPLPS